MSQAQVPPETRREIELADPRRWTDPELLALLVEACAIAALTPPFALALASVGAIALGGLWFVLWLDYPKR